MLKIILSLVTFAALIWLPITIYIVRNKNKASQVNPVSKRSISVDHQRFGKGSLSHFRLYLKGESNVSIKSVQDICEWLMECQYVSDYELFRYPDLWQHPLDFEVGRKGDCEDHCLWAWRKLHDLGIEAEFVVGKIALKNGGWGDHTWILLKNGGSDQIIETTAKRMDQFMVTASKAEHLYRPYYSMDTKLQSYVYQGLSKQ
jgi:predicted transglutaminase-like cysteine proteinase